MLTHILVCMSDKRGARAPLCVSSRLGNWKRFIETWWDISWYWIFLGALAHTCVFGELKQIFKLVLHVALMQCWINKFQMLRITSEAGIRRRVVNVAICLRKASHLEFFFSSRSDDIVFVRFKFALYHQNLGHRSENVFDKKSMNIFFEAKDVGCITCSMSRSATFSIHFENTFIVPTVGEFSQHNARTLPWYRNYW